MDQTLWAILIGAGVSLGTTVLTHILMISKEKRQWDRERQSRLEDQKSIEEKEKRDLLRDAYSHSIEASSALLSNMQGATRLTREKFEFYIGVLNKWLAVITIANSDHFDKEQKENFLGDYGYVTKTMEPLALDNLRETLISMSSTDIRI